ncbi:hypothetical protein CIHG_00739 [Coccidioides immitis H538.4]|uniref:Uncharacterized protein n=2 Tax=Coccidioides immitis TaxID=5501 RepID=A0A0J8RDG0_COCIT|nr:hypothetical protein CIRG_03158 [Coccidioides immitis RMSCC 2394]KMU82957.1 hypothetical protein CIHG_00739 [Coccidioides immitis H538.4]
MDEVTICPEHGGYSEDIEILTIELAMILTLQTTYSYPTITPEDIESPGESTAQGILDQYKWSPGTSLVIVTRARLTFENIYRGADHHVTMFWSPRHKTFIRLERWPIGSPKLRL